MLGDDHSHGLWEASAPPAPPTQALEGSVTVDTVVIGAGYTGLSAALHLARAGQSVAVIEAAEIGFGASGRNSGLVNAGLWVMPDELPRILGPVHGPRLLDILKYSPRLVFGLVQQYGMDCEADPRGTYHMAWGQSGLSQLRERVAQWRRHGVELELLDADETRRRTGALRYAGSLYDTRAGTIQPLAYARGLARAALQEGAMIFTGSPVTSFAPDGDGWIVRTERGEARGRWLVISTDMYSTASTTRVREAQVGLPYFHVATRPLSDNVRRTILPDGGGTWDTKTVLSGFRLDARGRLIIGSVGALRAGGQSLHPAWARRYIRNILPQVGEVEFESAWFGHIGMTGDHLPRLHTFGPRSIGISAYNGRGIGPGTVMGREIARAVMGEIGLEDMPLPVSYLTMPPFRPLREAYYELGAQIAHSPLTPV